jgi:hypothetical protein
LLEITSLTSAFSDPAAIFCNRFRSVVPLPEMSTAIGTGREYWTMGLAPGSEAPCQSSVFKVSEDFG